MTTYYVSKAGADSDNGTTPALAKLTILAAIQAADTSGDTVEIIDEGTYAEDDIGINVANLTITHTASWLGRPVLDGEESELNAFDVTAANATYIGLEIKGYGLDEGNGAVFNQGGSGFHTFHMSGCFIHDCSRLGTHSFVNTDAANPTTLKQCIMFFDPYGVYNGITNGDGGYMEISNCLITSSTATRSVLLDYGVLGTASFSTFINRGTTSKPMVRFAKVIDCIITGSGMGVASNDHTYNLVNVASIPYRNLDDDALSATGSGDVTGEDPVFIDGEEAGAGATIAENYNLQSTSPAAEAGIAYDGIVVDITGTVRPYGCGAPSIGCFEFQRVWTNLTDEEEFPFSTDFTNNRYANLTATQRFRACYNPEQVPFSRGIRGPATLRGRNTPYKAE